LWTQMNLRVHKRRKTPWPTERLPASQGLYYMLSVKILLCGVSAKSDDGSVTAKLWWTCTRITDSSSCTGQKQSTFHSRNQFCDLHIAVFPSRRMMSNWIARKLEKWGQVTSFIITLSEFHRKKQQLLCSQNRKCLKICDQRETSDWRLYWKMLPTERHQIY